MKWLIDSYPWIVTVLGPSLAAFLLLYMGFRGRFRPRITVIRPPPVYLVHGHSIRRCVKLAPHERERWEWMVSTIAAYLWYLSLFASYALASFIRGGR